MDLVIGAAFRYVTINYCRRNESFVRRITMQTLEAKQVGELPFEKIVTSSDLMLPVFEQASRVAEVDTTVLIRGESGAGKELVAEAIHANSPRQRKPLVIINMAAVSKDLLESELFGHIAGAFTGSTATRKGRFEAAHEGTLFIDEIGDLALECQAKLLRVLETHCVTPVGSNQDRHIDVRVIAATNRDLERMVREGQFREEL
jgi:transcriptional regulator with GAF, ATPase, and Fis domain